MNYDMVKALRTDTGLHQSELAKLFHCTADYILELDNKKVIDISKYNKNEAKLIRDLIAYINNKNKQKY